MSTGSLPVVFGQLGLFAQSVNRIKGSGQVCETDVYSVTTAPDKTGGRAGGFKVAWHLARAVLGLQTLPAR